MNPQTHNSASINPNAYDLRWTSEIEKLPQSFRLPRKGERDPIFGLSRSWFYKAEACGRIHLTRVSLNNRRGIVYVRTAEILSLMK
jgi:hypothetical protein